MLHSFATSRREFMRHVALGVGSVATSTSVLGQATGASVGVPASRLERLATGTNVCRWFRFPRQESAEHLGEYLSESETELMARIGLRHVRLCVAPQLIMDRTSGAVREDRLPFVESALRRFHRAGLLVIVNLHNEDRKAEVDPAWQAAFERFWRTFATRLETFDPELTILEIVNEPVFDRREEEWNVLNARLATAIRSAAPRHTLMTSGPNWGGLDGLRKLRLLADSNVVYSFHCYDPFPFTHQGATWASEAVKPLRGVPYPATPEDIAPLLPALESHPASKALLEKYGKDRWNRAKLSRRFRQGLDWAAQHRVPIYCGEFGVFPPHTQAQHRANWFRDFGAVLTESRIGWAVWGWDEGFGFNRRLVDGKLVIDPVVVEALGLKAV